MTVCVLDAFETTQVLETHMNPNVTLFVSCIDGTVHVDPVALSMEEMYKICIRFGLPRDIVHGTVYMFRKTDARGPLFIHESAEHVLAVSGDTECVRGRLRISSMNGSISVSKTVWNYIFRQHACITPPRTPLAEVNSNAMQMGTNASIKTFHRCVETLMRMEQNHEKLAEDIVYIAYMMRIPENVYQQYYSDILAKIQQHGGNIQRVIDAHSRASRLSTLIHMSETP